MAVSKCSGLMISISSADSLAILKNKQSQTEEKKNLNRGNKTEFFKNF